MFQEVVLIEYPRKGLYSLAYITADVPADIAKAAERESEDNAMVFVFIPTTPKPNFWHPARGTTHGNSPLRYV